MSNKTYDVIQCITSRQEKYNAMHLNLYYNTLLLDLVEPIVNCLKNCSISFLSIDVLWFIAEYAILNCNSAECKTTIDVPFPMNEKIKFSEHNKILCIKFPIDKTYYYKPILTIRNSVSRISNVYVSIYSSDDIKYSFKALIKGSYNDVSNECRFDNLHEIFNLGKLNNYSSRNINNEWQDCDFTTCIFIEYDANGYTAADDEQPSFVLNWLSFPEPIKHNYNLKCYLGPLETQNNKNVTLAYDGHMCSCLYDPMYIYNICCYKLEYDKCDVASTNYFDVEIYTSESFDLVKQLFNFKYYQLEYSSSEFGMEFPFKCNNLTYKLDTERIHIIVGPIKKYALINCLKNTKQVVAYNIDKTVFKLPNDIKGIYETKLNKLVDNEFKEFKILTKELETNLHNVTSNYKESTRITNDKLRIPPCFCDYTKINSLKKQFIRDLEHRVTLNNNDTSNGLTFKGSPCTMFFYPMNYYFKEVHYEVKLVSVEKLIVERAFVDKVSLLTKYKKWLSKYDVYIINQAHKNHLLEHQHLLEHHTDSN